MSTPTADRCKYCGDFIKYAKGSKLWVNGTSSHCWPNQLHSPVKHDFKSGF